MNHRWENDICIHCHLTREMKDYSRVVRTYSRLSSDGCFHDVPVREYGRKYWYGPVHGFVRPGCERGITKTL